MDLRTYSTVGIIDFTSSSKTRLKQNVTQNYIEALQAAQPGVRILELGAIEQVLKKVKSKQLDPDAIRTIGRHYRVDALLFGQLTVSEPKPNFRLSSTWESLKASADVEASLLAKIWETASGVTLWTSSSKRTETVAGINADTGGNISFGAADPQDTYGELVPVLVYENTKDFRSSFEYRRVK